MQNKIFARVLKWLGDLPSLPGENELVALQLLVWLRLSERGELPPELSVDQALSGTIEQFGEAMGRLEKEHELVGQAFAGLAAQVTGRIPWDVP